MFRASDLGVLGTESQLKEEAKMARLVGTGKDPLGRYGKGEVFDVPAPDESGVASDPDTNNLYQELLDKGWAKKLDPEDDPGRTKTQIADSMVRNEPLAHPVEQEIAEEIGDDAHAIVQLGDPNATKEDLGPLGRAPDDGVDVEAGTREPGDVTRSALSSVIAGEQAKADALAEAEAADKKS